MLFTVTFNKDISKKKEAVEHIKSCLDKFLEEIKEKKGETTVVDRNTDICFYQDKNNDGVPTNCNAAIKDEEKL